MTGMARLRLGLVLVSVLVVQLSLLDGLSIFGAHPDALLLVAAGGGLAGGPQRGAVVGFAAGLASDLFLTTPFGLSALAFTLVGFGVGLARASLIQSVWWITPVIAILASAAGVVLYALLGATVGQSQMLGDRLALIVGVVALANGVLSPVVVPVVRWAMGRSPVSAAGSGNIGSGRLAPGTIRVGR